MALKEYQFWGQYKLPAWLVYFACMDGVYIDGGLFETNTPVTDGTVHIVVAPASQDFTEKIAEFSIPTFQDGQVVRISHRFSWLPNSVSTQSCDLQYNGHPYGMGLNVIAVELAAVLPLTSSIWFNVLWKFSMEVG